MNLIDSVRSFKYKYPKFGRGEKNRLPISHSKVSPYYWWWAYLQKNEEYRKCCAQGGRGKLAKLYADFGDVYELEFRLWWGRLKRGAYLFGEQEKNDRINQVSSLERCAEALQNPSIILARIPINESKSQLLKSFKLFLRDKHQTKRGRRKVVSTALYPFCSTPSVSALEQTLTVYEAWQESLKAKQNKTLADIGIELRLVREFIPHSKDTPKQATSKRNKMSATVSRYIRDAEAIIANTALGRFPDKSRPAKPKKASTVDKPNMEVYEYWQKRKKKNPNITLAEIGFKLKLGRKEWLPTPNDSAKELVIKRNKMSATVSRIVKNAQSQIDNDAHANKRQFNLRLINPLPYPTTTPLTVRQD